ncbi:hypothetical protein T440DRAFT_490741 [Plenodomus tracheiphilus IPT5]|uniref:Uncharacterized protein n=1 Tax=Plenodomus tracheiphilus IPT5 TaxID=1408161 RepID=A0A6A7B1Q3_9PLEO|nr:hypothetical protein T440DRAFT_490741 [Plenodomus tracheiphilus IPT5]
MSYEHEPAGPICQSLTTSLLSAATQIPLLRRCGVTAICVAATHCLAVSHSLVRILHGHSAGGSLQTVLTSFAATSSCRTLLPLIPSASCGIYHQTPIASLQNNTLPTLVTGLDPITLASSLAR